MQDITKNWFCFSSSSNKFNFYFIIKIGYRTAAAELDLSDILPADVEAQVKEAAEISMGTEISEEDITNIRHLCVQVCLVELIEMRTKQMSHVRI